MASRAVVIIWHLSLEGLWLLVEVVWHTMLLLLLLLLTLLLGLVLLKECCPRATV